MADSSAGFKPPEQGKTTIDDKLSFEPERLSYESAKELAQCIACAVAQNVSKKRVVIVRTAVLADFANLNATDTVLRQLQLEYQTLAEQATAATAPIQHEGAEEREVGAIMHESVLQGAAVAGVAAATAAVAGGPVTAVVGAALGLAALLKQDVEYHGEQTTVDALAFEIALGNELKSREASAVFIPDLAVLAPVSGPKSLRGHLAKIQAAQAQAWSAMAPLIANLAALERDLDLATRAKDQTKIDDLTAKIAAARRTSDPLSLPLERADERYSDLQTQWAQVDTVSGLSLLARMLRAEALHALGALYLHATVVCSGGHYRISRNFFRMVGFSDGLSFSGSAITRWALLNADGSLEKGGLLTKTLKFG